MSSLSDVADRRSLPRAESVSRLALQDCLFLAAAAVFSLALYVTRLGFYSDDWAFLALLHGAGDASPAGLFRALFSGDVIIRQRPVQVAHLALLYRLSGLSPLGYHLANALALVGAGVLFYLVLRELELPRLPALAAPLVYLLLPHYSTDRFWVAAFQATLSVLFYFAGLYAGLRAVRPGAGWAPGWRLLGFTGLLLSGLAYEVTVPLFLLNPILAGAAARRAAAPQAGRKVSLLAAGDLAALLAVLGYKLLVTVRLGEMADLPARAASLVVGALRVNFGIYGLGLPYVAGWILRWRPDGLLLASSAVLGAGVYVYLSRQKAPDRAAKRAWLALAAAGLLVFALGYAVFLASDDAWFTSASLGNRIAIAAAVGVALVYAGACGLAVLPLRSPAARRRLFSLLVAGLCAAGFLINNTLAGFWIQAYRQQQALLAGLRDRRPDLPAHAVVVLDGVCLETGGAYLFTGKRDVAAVLQIAYGNPTLGGSAVTNPPGIEPQGLSLSTYGDEDFFPYGENLLVYNAARQEIYPLRDERAARDYFAGNGFSPPKDCPPGFAWGLNAP